MSDDADKATEKRDPRSLLRAAGLSPKKSFGQNFLVADGVTDAIAIACVPDADVGRATVVELGAGTGALTSRLLLRAKHVTAVERDRDLLPVLARVFASEIESTQLTLLEADAQTINVPQILGDFAPRVLCGNLPYQITGRLLSLATKHADCIERAVFMVQEEVADRLVANPSTKDYGALTVFTRAAFDVTKVRRVSRGCFFPEPDVTSAVVLLTSRAKESQTVEDDPFRDVVHRAFQARRKTLRNAWRELFSNMEELTSAAERAGISLDLRGETLDVSAFAKMAAELRSSRVLRPR